MSSNSNRIEVATRQHVGATLTSQMIADLVKVSFPDWKGGVYPSDCAYVRSEEGMKPRGKVAYGDGVLEYLAENSFKVLPTEQIVRRPRCGKKAEAAPAAPAPEPVVAKPEKKSSKKKAAGKTQAKPPVATRSRGADARATL